MYIWRSLLNGLFIFHCHSSGTNLSKDVILLSEIWTFFFKRTNVSLLNWIWTKGKFTICILTATIVRNCVRNCRTTRCRSLQASLEIRWIFKYPWALCHQIGEYGAMKSCCWAKTSDEANAKRIMLSESAYRKVRKSELEPTKQTFSISLQQGVKDANDLYFSDRRYTNRSHCSAVCSEVTWIVFKTNPAKFNQEDHPV